MFTSINDLFGITPKKWQAKKIKIGGAHRVSLLILAFVGLLGYFRLPYTGVLIIIMLGVTVYEFIKRMDQGLPLMQIAALLAVLQWNVGAWLTYNVNFFYSTYFMRVSSDEYFAYSIPGTAAFVIGLLSVGLDSKLRGILQNTDRSQFMEIGLVLATVGFASGLAMKVVPGGLTFVFYLASQLRYVAAVYFLFSKSPFRFVCAAISLLPLFIGSAQSAMFHDVMLWIALVGCYWYAMKRRRLWLTLLLLLFGFVAGFTVQGVKKSYREKVWNEEDASMTQEISQFWANRHAVFGEENLSNAIIRINQGWIIAAIMQNVPTQEKYAMGDTLGDALSAALIPRIAVEDKTKAGGQVNYRRFTGLPMSDKTSMGLSLLGESYANVGPDWGILLSLLFGVFMAISFGLCLKWAVKHPTFYFWIPVIFCQTLKAETDFVTTLNHITKGSVVAFFLYWLICEKLFPVRMISTGNASRKMSRLRKQSRRGGIQEGMEAVDFPRHHAKELMPNNP